MNNYFHCARITNNLWEWTDVKRISGPCFLKYIILLYFTFIYFVCSIIFIIIIIIITITMKKQYSKT